MANTSLAFEALSRLFRGDKDKTRRALEVFEGVTRSDLERLDQAHACGDWIAIGGLMHRMKSACQQIGEIAAADAMLVVENELKSAEGARESALAAARDELEKVQDRVARYLAMEHNGGQAECDF